MENGCRRDKILKYKIKFNEWKRKQRQNKTWKNTLEIYYFSILFAFTATNLRGRKRNK